MLFIDLIVYRQSYSFSSKLSSLSKSYCAQLKLPFIIETILSSRSTWIFETISRVWEATKIKVQTVANSLVWECFDNYDGVLFNFAIKLYTELLNFFLYRFLKIMVLCFFSISNFVVVKEYVVNSKHIFMLFLTFACHFYVYLSELFWASLPELQFL